MTALANKLKPYASWAALIASIIMIALQAWTHTINASAQMQAQQDVTQQKVTALETDTVRRREMDDLKDSVRRIETKVDAVLANQRKQ